MASRGTAPPSQPPRSVPIAGRENACSISRVCVAADRPRASLLASSAPGTIYIATSPDVKVVWLMATVLPHNASDTVSWLRGRNGEPLVLTDLSLSEMYLRLAN